MGNIEHRPGGEPPYVVRLDGAYFRREAHDPEWSAHQEAVEVVPVDADVKVELVTRAARNKLTVSEYLRWMLTGDPRRDDA